MVLSFSPHASASQTQLFLPEILHVVTLLVSAGPLLMRVSVHAIVVDALQSLATLAPSGEVDIKALHALLAQVAEPEMLRAFGLMRSATGLVMYPDAPRDNGPDTSLLNAVEKVTMFLSDVIRVGSATAGELPVKPFYMLWKLTCTDLANMWRARWMGLVAATCFQHNPATQPQAFIVLGSLARDDIDDDLVYQILVALRAALLQFGEANTVLVIAMLRCLSRVVLGLSPESRYASSMFWLSVAVLQLGHLPTYTAGVELLNLSLQAMRATNFFDGNLETVLLQARQAIGDPTRRLDQVAGVSFETSMSFSLAALLYKGLRHPATRTSASSALSTLLELSTETVDKDARLLYPVQLGYFFALIPVLSSTSSDIRKLFTIAGLPKDSGDPPKVTYNLISLP
jgi:neurofibromin 1